MKKIIVAIGGGENGRLLDDGEYAPYDTEVIDKEIVSLTNKKNPNFLFLGHAMHNSLAIQESYFETMKKIYGEKFSCNCLYLKSTELNDKKKVKEYINWADIIYEGGGDTEVLIKLWKETEFDKVLHNAWQKGKIICGVSAGAVCWFNSCSSDSTQNKIKNTNFGCINCLNWIDLHLTPHSNEEGRAESTKQQLVDKDIVGIMLSNCAALEIINDKYKFISSNVEAFALKAYWKNNKYIEKKCEFLKTHRNIDEIIKKELNSHRRIQNKK